MKFNNLNRYRVGGTDSNMQLAIKPPATPSGRIYRMSPNEDAHPQHFVMGNPSPDFEITAEARKRMKLEPRSKQTVCPYSGVVAPDESFTHPDDRQAALDMVKQAAVEDMRAAVSDMLRGVASRSKSITYRPAPRRAKPRLTFHRADLLRDLVCDHCSRDYGVYAIGLFCPDCGAPNLRLHFEREHALVNAQVELAEAQDEGLEELSYRLLGNAHEDVLTAFEATLKTVYLFGIANRPEGAPAVKPVANDFQNLERAEKRFKDLDFNPFDGLGEDDLATLRLNIQKRHIIGHNLGVVDAKFAEHANEARIGETVHLVGDDIKRFAAICQAVIDRLDEWLCGAPSPTLGSTSEETAKSPKPKEPKKKTLDIRFDTDRATLQPDGRKAVEQITALLKAQPGLNLSIEGHTDDTGTPARNAALSMERAEAVQAILVQSGIAENRLKVAGYGAARPVSKGAAEADRAANRRVELVRY